MKNLKKKLKKVAGFSLVELLIVVAILAILAVVSIPMFSNSTAKAETAVDDANLRAAKAVAYSKYLEAAYSTGSVPPSGETEYFDAVGGTVVPSAPSPGYGHGTNGVIEITWGGESDPPTVTWVAGS